MVDFGGWDMPVLYRSIIDEHHHTRNVAGAFDVSHMGRLYVSGPDAESFLERICTRRLADTPIGQSRYANICNSAGRILDDVIVSRAEDHWLIVCNAGNREKIVAWLNRHAGGRQVKIQDRTEATAMIAIQGPRAVPIAEALLAAPINKMKRYGFIAAEHDGVDLTIFRSGYTGEDGIEIIAPASAAETLWTLFCKENPDPEIDVLPVGLGARDTLRCEAAMPLYGHELTEAIDPISAGLQWAVNLTKNFIGADALRKIDAAGPKQKRIGLKVDSKRIARQDTPVLQADRPVGTVTSGIMSPTLQQNLAMAYVNNDCGETGNSLTVDIRGKRADALVVPLPFYKKPQEAFS
jgi:aminomethyltransferase